MYCMKKKTFVILGATSGIGNALAQKLSSYGARLILTGRDGHSLDMIASKIATPKQVIKIDVYSNGFEDLLTRELLLAKKSLGADTLNGGIYCAGISPLLPLRGITEEHIEQTFKINYTGAIIFSKILSSKSFRTDQDTSIVLVSSVRSQSGEKGLGVYGASKAALEASARAFSKELAPLGVRINCISPGWLDTKMNKDSSVIVDGLEEKMKQIHPLGLGSANDISSAAAFLLSNDAKWITGTNMVVDGGFLA